MKVHFILRKKSDSKENDPRTIYLVVREGKNKKIRFSMYYSVRVAEWNIKTERVREIATILNRFIINQRLNTVETAVNSFIISQVGISLDDLAIKIKEYLHPAEQPKAISFMQFLNNYLIEAETRPSRQGGEKLAFKTKQKFRQLSDCLNSYCEYRHKKLSFDSFSIDFYNDFLNYLYDVRNVSIGYAGMFISKLKQVLRSAEKRGIEVNQAYKDYRVLKEEADNIYLTETELKQIENVELTESLSNMRNLFLIGCYTGLRYSDFSRLTTDNIEGNNIRIRQQKTGDEVIIPLLSDYVKNLIINGNYRKISSQKLNEGIKEVCKRAGITGKFMKTISKGGEKQTLIFNRWEKVSTHTARRSFATNLFLRGVPSLSIMKITGHHSETVFMKYIKIDKEQNADLIKQQLNK
jgi:integrase